MLPLSGGEEQEWHNSPVSKCKLYRATVSLSHHRGDPFSPFQSSIHSSYKKKESVDYSQKPVTCSEFLHAKRKNDKLHL